MQVSNLQYAPIGVCPVIHVSQFDVGRQFQLKIFDGDSAYSMPNGTTARLDGIKPDKHGFSYTDAVSVSGNTVTVTTKEQMTIVSGIVICEIRFLKNDDTIGTLNFKLDVEESPINENTDISETEIPTIIQLATEQMLNAEAWATGTKDGEAVEDTEPQYHNNSKYYSEQSANSATASATSATASSNSAIASESSRGASANSAELSESWAVGGTGSRTGEDTNNAKYWSQQSQIAVEDFETYKPYLIAALGTIYITTESGDNIVTESGDRIICDL